jgi:tape measure domain-containing protein
MADNKVQVSITADTSQLDAGLEGAASAVEKFAESTKSTSDEASAAIQGIIASTEELKEVLAEGIKLDGVTGLEPLQDTVKQVGADLRGVQEDALGAGDALKQTFDGAKTTAQRAAEWFKGTGQALDGVVTKTERLDEAFEQLHIRSLAEIRNEIMETNLALETMARDGIASFEELERATAAAGSRIKELEAEMTAPMRRMEAEAREAAEQINHAFGKLGIRGAAQIEAEAHEVRAALAEIKASANSTSQDVVRATAAMEAKLAELAEEAKAIKIEANTEALDTATGKVLAVTAAFAALFETVTQVKEALEEGVAYDRTIARFSAIAGSARGAADEYNFVKKVAMEFGLTMGELADNYGRLMEAAKGTNMAGEKTRELFEALSHVASTYGMSTLMMKNAFLAIEEMMSKGIVQERQLRTQLGNDLPGAFEAAARAAHVTTAELAHMIEKGKLLSDDFLPAFTEELNKMGQTNTPVVVNVLSNAVTTLQNHFVAFYNEVTHDGVFQWLTKEVSLLNAKFDEMENNGQLDRMAQDIADKLVHVMDALKDTVTALSKFGGAIETITKLAFDAWLVKVAYQLSTLGIITKITAGLEAFRAATIAAEESALVLGNSISKIEAATAVAGGGLMAFLGRLNPVGLALGGLAAVGIAWQEGLFNIASGTDDASTAMDKFNAAIKKANTEGKDLNAVLGELDDKYKSSFAAISEHSAAAAAEVIDKHKSVGTALISEMQQRIAQSQREHQQQLAQDQDFAAQKKALDDESRDLADERANQAIKRNKENLAQEIHDEQVKNQLKDAALQQQQISEERKYRATLQHNEAEARSAISTPDETGKAYERLSEILMRSQGQVADYRTKKEQEAISGALTQMDREKQARDAAQKAEEQQYTARAQAVHNQQQALVAEQEAQKAIRIKGAQDAANGALAIWDKYAAAISADNDKLLAIQNAESQQYIAIKKQEMAEALQIEDQALAERLRKDESASAELLRNDLAAFNQRAAEFNQRAAEIGFIGDKSIQAGMSNALKESFGRIVNDLKAGVAAEQEAFKGEEGILKASLTDRERLYENYIAKIKEADDKIATSNRSFEQQKWQWHYDDSDDKTKIQMITEKMIEDQEKINEVRKKGATATQEELAAQKSLIEDQNKLASDMKALGKDATDSYGVVIEKTKATEEAEKILTQAHNNDIETLKQQKAVAEAGAQAAKNDIEAIKQKMEELKQKESALGEVIKLNIDTTSLDQLLDKLKDAHVSLAALTMGKVAEITGATQEAATNGIAPMMDASSFFNDEIDLGLSDLGAFATGGSVTGPGTGTSDSIPAFLSNGEFVISANAVSKYGLSFLNKLNSGDLPKFASGGLVGSGSNISSDIVSIELRLPNNSPFAMSGSRDTAMGLAAALRELARGQ